MKIALVHDHLLEFGGAERVLVALKKMYPEADVYLAAYDPNVTRTHIPDFKSWNVRTSWAARIPFYNKLYSPLRFLAPFIWESFNFNQYDLVISSSGWFSSKGIKTDQRKTKHISYVHHPPGYLYGYQTAVEWQRYWPVKIYALVVNHFLRMWDYKAAQRPDVLIANSQETRRRLHKYYRRDSHVVYPPVDMPQKLSGSVRASDAQQYFVSLSRLAYKKHVDILIRAANEYGFRLKVAGQGRDFIALQQLAGPTVEMCGRVTDEQRDKLLDGAKAFLNASVEEEFGIAPVEAMGRGIPVIAYASGGLKETVKDGNNGYLLHEHTPEAFGKAIAKLNALPPSAYNTMRKAARKEALSYSHEAFARHIKGIVTRSV